MTPEALAAEIRAEIAALPRRDTPSIRALRKRRSDELKRAPAELVLAGARALELAQPQEGKWVAYELIRHHPAAYAAFAPDQVEDYASRLASWYSVDAFGTILSGPLWAKGRLPDAIIAAWSASDTRWLRRLALVSSVGRNGVRAAPGATFELCLRLAGDRDDMVEKAVSWALRYLSQKDRAAVAAFMAEHSDRFTARVRREVRHKLDTGRKAPRRTA